jgi:hypothetical protein
MMSNERKKALVRKALILIVLTVAIVLLTYVKCY